MVIGHRWVYFAKDEKGISMEAKKRKFLVVSIFCCDNREFYNCLR